MAGWSDPLRNIKKNIGYSTVAIEKNLSVKLGLILRFKASFTLKFFSIATVWYGIS